MEIVSSIVVLQPGMYILRHPKAGLPPLTVARAPGSASSTGKIEIIATQKTHNTILRDGADCIVMHVMHAPVELLVTAYISSAGAVVPSLKVDQIGLDPEPIQSMAMTPAVTAPVKAINQVEISGKGISIIGHIELGGDLVAGEGQRLGDPARNLRLEGFQVMWPDRPEGVDLAYGIEIEGIGTKPVVSSGKFCGSRGEARRITEVTFALTGPKAVQFRLDGVAYFSGGFQVAVASGIALSGPSGMEHLTSLSLRVLPAKPTEKAGKNPWDASDQTKVFKAKTKAATKADAKKVTASKTVLKKVPVGSVKAR